MSLIKLSIRHGQTLANAQQSMEDAVQGVSTRFAPFIQTVNWSEGRQSVDIQGRGFDVQMQLDEQEVHVQGNIAILGKLLGSRAADGVKALIEGAFQKKDRLTDATNRK